MIKRKVFIVDDEKYIRELIQVNLEDKFDIMCCENGLDVVNRVIEYKPDIIILDIMLPGLNGFEVCSLLRKDERTKNIPIIILTVKKEEQDKVKGLKLGADDYVTKPFSVNELIARIEAVLRRSNSEFNELKNDNIIIIGNIVINNETYQVTKNNKEINLTLKEFKLLQFLARKRGKIVSRDELLNEVWDGIGLKDSRTLDVYIRKLRKKIENNDKFPEYIETVRGVGYKMK